MNEPSATPKIDPQLEARIVALVLGEASDFERDELNLLIAQRPELRALKEEIESVNGVLEDIAKGEWIGDDEDWKLPSEKRRVVEAAIRGESVPPAILPLAHGAPLNDATGNASMVWSVARIAAVLAVAGFFVVVAMVTTATFQLAASRKRADATAMFGENAAADWEFEAYDAPVTAESPAANRASGSIAAIELRSDDAQSTAAMSALRESLQSWAPGDGATEGYYLRDDVEYLPAKPAQKRFSQPGVNDFSSPASSESDLAYMLPEVRANEVGQQQGQSGDPSMPSTPTASDFALGGMRFGRQQADIATQFQAGGNSSDFAPPSGPEVSWGGVPESGRIVMNADSRSVAVAPGGEPQSATHLWSFDAPMRESEPKSEASNKYDEQSVEASSEEGRKSEIASNFGMPFSGFQDPALLADVEAERYRLKAAPAGQAATMDEKADAFADDVTSNLADLQERASPERMDSNDAVWFDHKAMGFDLDGVVTLESTPAPEPKPALPGETVPEYMAKQEQESAGERIAGRAITRGGESSRFGSGMKFSDEFGVTMKAPPTAGLEEINTAEQAFSTFSLHVSDVSFKLAISALAQGEWPEASKIRIEEFVNAFDYGDPQPRDHERVGCRVEQAIHPFLQQRNLLRVSIRTGSAGRASNTPLRLTFLIDNSGSMERVDRQQTVRRAFELLAGQLQPTDQVTLLSFARQPRLLADQVSGSQAEQLVQIIQTLPSDGGTNIESALQLAFEKAQEQQLDGAQNRIVLLTDGAVNLGDADPASLARIVTSMRDRGIAFDAAGISAEGLNDEILEALTRQGDGRYYLLDSPDVADEGFVRQIAGALRPSAKNVKVQVEFNPKRVGSYKLLGFEKHLLNQEDFRNDSVDAAEMAANEAGVAVYQFEAKPDGEGDVGSVSVRFRDLSTGQMVENRWPIPYEPDAPRMDQAPPSMQIATTAAMLAAKLRAEPLGQAVDLKTLARLVTQLPDRYRNSDRVQQLGAMIQVARQLSGN